MDIQSVLACAVRAAMEAGHAIMEIRNGGFRVHYKSDSSPVTAADFTSNQTITEILRESFPEIPQLTEETADDAEGRMNSEYCFIVDPLDGTKEFIRGREEFTVNIALSRGDKPVMGVIYVPCTDTMYFAAENCGAFRLDEASLNSQKKAVPIHSSSRTDKPVLVTGHTGAERIHGILGDAAEIKPLGSSLKGCLVADGSADICVCPHPTHEWDTAAMQCICAEAGAEMYLLDGSIPRCNQEDTVNHGGFYILNCAENAGYVNRLFRK